MLTDIARARKTTQTITELVSLSSNIPRAPIRICINLILEISRSTNNTSYKDIVTLIVITAKVHENRSQITIGVTEQCERIVEKGGCGLGHCWAISDLNKIS